MKIYLLWKKDMTEWTDVPDVLVNIYKNKSDAESSLEKLSGKFKEEVKNSDICVNCPVNKVSALVNEIYEYCKKHFNKRPTLDTMGYCEDYNPIPFTNDEYIIEERELIE